MRPVIYLDIDGAVKPEGGALINWMWPDVQRHEYYMEHPQDRAGLHEYWLSKSLGRRLVELSKVADLKWLTGWGVHANEAVGKVLGLPELEVLGAWDIYDVDTAPWKLEALKAELETEARPFVFVDDIHITKEVQDWAAGLKVPSLLITTTAFCGLTPGQLDRVQNFVDIWK